MAVSALLIVLTFGVYLFHRHREHYKNIDVVKRYEPSMRDPHREQAMLHLTLHPSHSMREQIDNNLGQLDRLKLLIEDNLYNLTSKEYHIKEILMRKPVSSNDFVVKNHRYPVGTYALFHFHRDGKNTHAYVPLTGTTGTGSEELVFSDLPVALEQHKSDIETVL